MNINTPTTILTTLLHSPFALIGIIAIIYGLFMSKKVEFTRRFFIIFSKLSAFSFFILLLLYRLKEIEILSLNADWIGYLFLFTTLISLFFAYTTKQYEALAKSLTKIYFSKVCENCIFFCFLITYLLLINTNPLFYKKFGSLLLFIVIVDNIIRCAFGSSRKNKPEEPFTQDTIKK